MRKIFFLVAIISVLFSCNNRETLVDKSELLGDDYRLFQNTPAWELAKAVEDENEDKINELINKDRKLLDYQEPVFGSTLLILTIKNQQYKSFEILLKNKANTKIHDTYEGSSALIEACNSKHYDVKFAKLLLEYGANVNDVQIDIDNEGKTRTPLMLASKTGKIDLVELLVKKGADLNYQNKSKQSALSEAIFQSEFNVVMYLLMNGADYERPIFYRPDYSVPVEKQDPNDKGKPMYLVDVLKENVADVDTDEYKYKMLIINFLKSKGID
nr:ankyrin repeat domain-containing protein [uncultured Flavobacterium sp.]